MKGTSDRRRVTCSILLAGWTLAIVVAVFPIGPHRDRPAWQQIAWIPFVSRPVTFDDVARNVLLYVPFGFLHAYASSHPAVGRALAHAAALSAATEMSQVYSRGRYPSATDVVSNVIGTMIGVACARRRTSHRTGGAPIQARDR